MTSGSWFSGSRLSSMNCMACFLLVEARAVEGIRKRSVPERCRFRGDRVHEMRADRNHLLELGKQLFDLPPIIQRFSGLGCGRAQNGLSPMIPARSIFRTAGQ